jgi:hypothetical protein
VKNLLKKIMMVRIKKRDGAASRKADAMREIRLLDKSNSINVRGTQQNRGRESGRITAQ